MSFQTHLQSNRMRGGTSGQNCFTAMPVPLTRKGVAKTTMNWSARSSKKELTSDSIHRSRSTSWWATSTPTPGRSSETKALCCFRISIRQEDFRYISSAEDPCRWNRPQPRTVKVTKIWQKARHENLCSHHRRTSHWGGIYQLQKTTVNSTSAQHAKNPPNHSFYHYFNSDLRNFSIQNQAFLFPVEFTLTKWNLLFQFT